MRRLAAGVVILAVPSVTACDSINTLERPAEPVVLVGNQLPSPPGVAPDRIVAFRYNAYGPGWKQIPVQVDERHVADLRAVHNNTTQYSLQALEYSDPGTLTGPDPNPNLDGNDEIVFMARDAFGRAPADVPDPRGVLPGSGYEVRISDPLNEGASAWAYLFVHDGSLDPGAGVDYVDYEFDLLAGEYPEDYDFDGRAEVVGDPPENPAPPANPENSRVTTPYYSEHFLDRWITDELRVTAGPATGPDILDRNRLGAAFDSCGRTENTFAAGHGAFVANIDGPVRAIRDYIGANSSAYTQRTQVFYQRREDLRTILRVHSLPAGPSDLLDFTGQATGMSYTNDLMDEPVTIDGQPDDVPTGELSWELSDGAQGSVVAAHRYETDIPGFEPTSIYLDDADPSLVPCTGDREARGTSGPSIRGGLPNTDPTPRGGGGTTYHLTSHRTHFYGPPGLEPATAAQHSAETRAPLEVEAGPRAQQSP